MRDLSPTQVQAALAHFDSPAWMPKRENLAAERRQAMVMVFVGAVVALIGIVIMNASGAFGTSTHYDRATFGFGLVIAVIGVLVELGGATIDTIAHGKYKQEVNNYYRSGGA